MVGTILLIAITVSLAAAVAVLVGRVRTPASPAPSASLEIAAENVDNENVRITITHAGGDPLPAEEIVVKARNAEGSLVVVPMTGWDVLTVGENSSGVFTYGPNPEEKLIEVQVIHKPSGQFIARLKNVLVE